MKYRVKGQERHVNSVAARKHSRRFSKSKKNSLFISVSQLAHLALLQRFLPKLHTHSILQQINTLILSPHWKLQIGWNVYTICMCILNTTTNCMNWGELHVLEKFKDEQRNVWIKMSQYQQPFRLNWLYILTYNDKLGRQQSREINICGSQCKLTMTYNRFHTEDWRNSGYSCDKYLRDQRSLFIKPPGETDKAIFTSFKWKVTGLI